MILLDLFCKAGGATRGYQRAGFTVFGVDIEPQPNYCGDGFLRMDALDYLRRAIEHRTIGQFAGIHASPPCHAYSTVTKRNGRNRAKYPDLIQPTRELLIATGVPYVIENVVGAPLLDAIRLCGSSFGLDVRRHRLFESSVPISGSICAHHEQKPRFRSLDSRQKTLATVIGVHGSLNYSGERELREKAMGIDWMSVAELSQAIPPAYTEFIGLQLADHIATLHRANSQNEPNQIGE